MFDDFFTRALIAGIGISLVTGPLGCFIVWRRLSFFAGTLAHSALLGVTMAFIFEINIALFRFYNLCNLSNLIIAITKENKITK